MEEIPENVFSLLLHEPGEEKHGLPTKNSDFYVGFFPKPNQVDLSEQDQTLKSELYNNGYYMFLWENKTAGPWSSERKRAVLMVHVSVSCQTDEDLMKKFRIEQKDSVLKRLHSVRKRQLPLY